MTNTTIEGIIRKIEVGQLDANDILHLCNAFAIIHGFTMNDGEVKKIRENGLEIIKSESGLNYNAGLGHSLNLKTEKGTLIVRYACSGGAIPEFDAQLEKYKELAKLNIESHKRLVDLNFI
ncbi:MAG: hypothetical protein AABW88_04645 [Nanoarchaeota archaeon]